MRTTAALDAILARLSGVRANGDGFLACCPAHEDRKQSLSVKAGDKGVVLNCFAGCETTDVVAAMGITMADLFDDRERPEPTPLRPKIVATYDYVDESGTLLYQAVRKEPKGFTQRHPDGAGGWIWNLTGVRLVPYHLPELLAYPDRTVWICEGEKDVDVLRERFGLLATTNAMGAGKWRAEFSTVLSGRSVVVIADNDQPGLTHANAVAASLVAAGCRVRVLTPPNVPPKGDISDWIAAGGTKEQLKALVAELSDWTSDAGDQADDQADPEWLEPIPLTVARFLPECPILNLPDWLVDGIVGISEETQTQPDLAFMMAMGALSAALGRTVEIRARDGWVEPVNTYGVAAQESGTRKTAVYQWFVSPIRDFEAELIKEAISEIAKAHSRKRILEKQLETAERDAAKAGPTDQSKQLVAEAAAIEVAAVKIPSEPRLLADDVTTEKAISLLAEQGKIAILSDEGGLFQIMGGAYSQNGSVNIDAYLKAHAGSDIRVDRVSRPSEVVRRPAITMALVVQPSVIEGLTGTPSFRGKGLLARFAYVVPPSRVGKRNARASAMDSAVTVRYADNLRALLALQPLNLADAHGRRRPHELVLTYGACELLVCFLEEIEPQLAPNGALGHIADWAGKLAGLCLRYAALLHVADQAEQLRAGHALRTDVPASVMERAIELGRYLIPHALTAFSIMGGDPATNDARYVLGVIEARRVTTLTVRDLFEATKGTLRKTERLKIALDVLEDHQMIRVAKADDKAGAGRKRSPVVTVNPMLFEKSANSAKDRLSSPFEAPSFVPNGHMNGANSTPPTPFAQFADSHNSARGADVRAF